MGLSQKPCKLADFRFLKDNSPVTGEKFIYFGHQWPTFYLAGCIIAAIGIFVLKLTKRKIPIWFMIWTAWIVVGYLLDVPSLPFNAVFALLGCWGMFKEALNPTNVWMGKGKPPPKQLMILTATMIFAANLIITIGEIRVLKLSPTSVTEMRLKGTTVLNKTAMEEKYSTKSGYRLFTNGDRGFSCDDGLVFLDSNGHIKTGDYVAVAIEKWGNVRPTLVVARW